MAIFRHLALGRYVDGASVVHRLDPRTKLLACALVTAGSYGRGMPSAVAA